MSDVEIPADGQPAAEDSDVEEELVEERDRQEEGEMRTWDVVLFLRYMLRSSLSLFLSFHFFPSISLFPYFLLSISVFPYFFLSFLISFFSISFLSNYFLSFFSFLYFICFSFFPILILLGSFQKNPFIFFTRKSFVKYFLLKFIKEFPLNWSRTSSRKIYKRIPFNFDMGSFYKGFPWEFFFPRKSFVKFF